MRTLAPPPANIGPAAACPGGITEGLVQMDLVKDKIEGNHILTARPLERGRGTQRWLRSLTTNHLLYRYPLRGIHLGLGQFPFIPACKGITPSRICSLTVDCTANHCDYERRGV